MVSGSDLGTVVVVVFLFGLFDEDDWRRIRG